MFIGSTAVKMQACLPLGLLIPLAIRIPSMIDLQSYEDPI